MIGRELGADRAVAVFLFHIGGAANELLRRLVIHEQRGVAADVSYRPVDDDRKIPAHAFDGVKIPLM
jgi:hypothetical protein